MYFILFFTLNPAERLKRKILQNSEKHSTRYGCRSITLYGIKITNIVKLVIYLNYDDVKMHFTKHYFL